MPVEFGIELNWVGKDQGLKLMELKVRYESFMFEIVTKGVF